jgi:hypothetical protein
LGLVKATKAAWTNLRTQFKRELKNYCGEKHSGTGGGDTDLYFGSWQFFHRLTFLRDTVTPRQTESNLDPTPCTARSNASVDQAPSTPPLQPPSRSQPPQSSSSQLPHSSNCEVHDFGMSDDEGLDFAETLIVEDDEALDNDISPGKSTTTSKK